MEGPIKVVAAIVPALNEEKTVADVLRVLKDVSEIVEIVLVSDGSTDGTAAVARALGVKVVELPENLGKGAAMIAGLKETQAEVVLFLDADLIGLTPEHVRELLTPVLTGESDMAIGVFDGGRKSTDLAQAIAPYLSGQRAVKRAIFDEMADLDLTRFGVEVALTRFMKRNGIRMSEVVLREMTHRLKEEKLGLVKGFAARMKMYWEIVKFLPKE